MGKISKNNRYAAHQELLKLVMLAFQKMFPNGRIYEQHVGLFFTKNGAPVKIGKKGQADLWAMTEGRLIFIEIKSGNARQTKEQKQWEITVKKCGHEYYVIRSVDDLISLQKR